MRWIGVICLVATVQAAEPQADLDTAARLAERLALSGSGTQAIALVIEADGQQHVAAVGGATVRTRFEFGSVTKAMTGSLLARLAAQGRLGLDDPLARHWPELAGRPAGALTLRQLATHHAGLPRVPDHWAMALSAIRHPMDPYRSYTRAELQQWLADWQGSTPATFRYSNAGFAVLGLTLERVTHQPYGELLAQELLRPAGLARAGTSGQAVLGHGWTGRPNPAWVLGPFEAAGALQADAEEMGRLLVRARSGLPPFDAGAQQPQADGSGPAHRAGLGWAITDAHGDQVVWHNGGTGGHRSFVGWSRQTGRAVVLAANGQVSLDELGRHLLNPAFELPPAERPAPGWWAWLALLLPLPSIWTCWRMAGREAPGAGRLSVLVSGASALGSAWLSVMLCDWRSWRWGAVQGEWVLALLVIGGLVAAIWRTRHWPLWPPDAAARVVLATAVGSLFLTGALLTGVWGA